MVGGWVLFSCHPTVAWSCGRNLEVGVGRNHMMRWSQKEEISFGRIYKCGWSGVVDIFGDISWSIVSFLKKIRRPDAMVRLCRM